MSGEQVAEHPPKGRCYHITGWDGLYEVNDHDGIRKPGQKRRARMPWVPLHISPPTLDGLNYYTAAAVAAKKYGPEAWAVAFGVFVRLLDIAAWQERGCRGYLLRSEDVGLSSRDIAGLSHFLPEQVELGLKVLADPEIGWIEEVECPEPPVTCGTSRNIHP
jgi:hypothetical protein